MALFDSVPIYIKTFGWRGLLCFGLVRYSSSRKPAPMFFRNNSKPTWVRPDSSDLLDDPGSFFGSRLRFSSTI